VDGLDASATNVRMARRLNRFPNVEFHEGLIEEAGDHFPYDAFDLVYAFGVLEHVRDVDETVTAALKLTRSGGRFCLSVALRELEAVGPLPEVASETTVRRVRVFTESGLRERFGGYPGFALTKLQGEWLLISKSGHAFKNRFELVIRDRHYGFPVGLVRGEVVAHGVEVDFYNEDLCDLPFPEGVGRYRWAVRGNVLHLDHMTKDPCATRGGVLDDAIYRRIR